MKIFPFYCNLVLTRNCNLRCKSCGVWKYPAKHCSTDEWKKIIDKISRLNTIKTIGITGGEILLRENVYEIIDYVYSKGINVVVNSNGTLPEEKYLKLLNTKASYIGISLHYMSSEKQDEFCGLPGTFEKIINNLKILKKNNKNKFLYVQCTLTADNYKEIIDLKDFVNKKLCLPFSLTPATWGGEGKSLLKTTDKNIGGVGSDFSSLEKELSKYGGLKVLRTKTYLDLALKAFKTGKKTWECKAGDWYFAISPEGRFSICQDIDTDLYILEEKFEEKLKQMKDNKEILRIRENCSGCTYPCYLENQSLVMHPWEFITKLINYYYWKYILKKTKSF